MSWNFSSDADTRLFPCHMWVMPAIDNAQRSEPVPIRAACVRRAGTMTAAPTANRRAGMIHERSPTRSWDSHSTPRPAGPAASA